MVVTVVVMNSAMILGGKSIMQLFDRGGIEKHPEHQENGNTLSYMLYFHDAKLGKIKKRILNLCYEVHNTDKAH